MLASVHYRAEDTGRSMDLSALLSALQSTQQTKATSRLSERNVVDLVNKLKQLGLLGDDLLHTINGKEYITIDQLRTEVEMALKQVPRMRTHFL